MSKTDNKPKIDIEFMLKEYEHIHNAMMNETAQSEQRVTFFLSISSAALATIGIMAQISNIPQETVFFVSEGILAVLLLYALTILNRLNARDAQNNAYKKMLVEIRAFFSGQDSSIERYINARKDILRSKPHKSRLVAYIANYLRGTLGDLMILTASLIITGMVLIALTNAQQPVSSIMLWVCVTFVVSAIGLNVIYDLLQPLLQTWES